MQIGRPRASVTTCSLEFIPLFVRPSRRLPAIACRATDEAFAPPFFTPQIYPADLPRRLEAVRWALNWVASIITVSVFCHHGLGILSCGDHFSEHPRKHPQPAAAPPSVIKCLWWAVFDGRNPPAHPHETVERTAAAAPCVRQSVRKDHSCSTALEAKSESNHR